MRCSLYFTLLVVAALSSGQPNDPSQLELQDLPPEVILLIADDVDLISRCNLRNASTTLMQKLPQKCSEMNVLMQELYLSSFAYVINPDKIRIDHCARQQLDAMVKPCLAIQKESTQMDSAANGADSNPKDDNTPFEMMQYLNRMYPPLLFSSDSKLDLKTAKEFTRNMDAFLSKDKGWVSRIDMYKRQNPKRKNRNIDLKTLPQGPETCSWILPMREFSNPMQKPGIGSTQMWNDGFYGDYVRFKLNSLLFRCSPWNDWSPNAKHQVAIKDSVEWLIYFARSKLFWWFQELWLKIAIHPVEISETDAEKILEALLFHHQTHDQEILVIMKNILNPNFWNDKKVVNVLWNWFLIEIFVKLDIPLKKPLASWALSILRRVPKSKKAQETTSPSVYDLLHFKNQPDTVIFFILNERTDIALALLRNGYRIDSNPSKLNFILPILRSRNNDEINRIVDEQI